MPQMTLHRRAGIGLGGFSILEVLVAVMVVSIGFTAIMSLLSFSSVSSELEQERARAHQMVSEEMELVKRTLYTRITTGHSVTVWNNGTPDKTSDDTVGTMEVVVRNPVTGAILTTAPIPAYRVEVEVTLTWHPRGPYTAKTMRETAMTYIAP